MPAAFFPRLLPPYVAFLLPVALAAQGTVPVSSEPRHHFQIQNPVVRVYDVVVPPGDTTFFHVHAVDYTFVSIGDAQLTAQVLGANPGPLDLRDGEVRFSRPVTHRVSNHGARAFHNLTIELLSRRDGGAAAVTLEARDSVVMDNDRERVVRSVIAPDEVRRLPTDERTLLVFLSAGTLHLIKGESAEAEIAAQPGTYRWVGDAAPRRIHNASAQPVIVLSFVVK